MRSLNKLSLVAATLMASSAMVQAADLIPHQKYDDQVEVTPHAVGGWYIRGDIGYASLEYDADTTFFQGSSQTGIISGSDLDSTWSIQGGIGYQVTDYFRVDATLSYYNETTATGSSRSIFSTPGPVQCNFSAIGEQCNFSDTQDLDATVLMANAYADLGTINGFTPYVGAGIGGAHVEYDVLRNVQNCVSPATCGSDGLTGIHDGRAQWRFAYAIHAGASYDINCKLKADAGYTFTRIEGGKAFGFTEQSGFQGTQGFDQGIDIHEGRVGLRYAVGAGDCHPPAQPPVVYK